MDGKVEGVLSHAAVCRPLATGYGDHAGDRAIDVMFPGELGGLVLLACDEGAEAGEDGEDVGAGDGGSEVRVDVGDEVVDLVVIVCRLHDTGGCREVRSADEDDALPRDGEDDATVFSLGDHEGVGAAEGVGGDDDVGAAADGEERGAGGLVDVAEVVRKDAGGVDDAFGVDGNFGAGLHVADDGSGDLVAGVEKLGAAGVVDDGGTVVNGGEGEGEGVAGVVELGIVVEDASGEVIGADAGDVFGGLFFAEDAGWAHAAFAGEEVVGGESGSEPRELPKACGGEDRREGMDEVGGGALHDGALVEGFADEVDLAGGEVAYAAVDELGRAGGGGLGEVACLDEGGLVAAGSGVYGEAEAGGSAAQDEDVVGGAEGGEEVGAGWGQESLVVGLNTGSSSV